MLLNTISLTWLSTILLTVGRIEIGRYLATDVFNFSPLGTGTTLAGFQSEGKTPVVSDRLNYSLVRLGAILYAVDLSILGEMPSAVRFEHIQANEHIGNII